MCKTCKALWTDKRDCPYAKVSWINNFINEKSIYEDIEERKNWISVVCEKHNHHLDLIIDDVHFCPKCIEEEDLINTPPHYTKWWIEPIDFSISNDLSFCEGNVVKYITRYKHKNWIEDLKKCQFYINKIIEGYEKTKGKCSNDYPISIWGISKTNSRESIRVPKV